MVLAAVGVVVVMASSWGARGSWVLW